MTLASWNCCDDPQVMFAFARSQLSDRQVRLFFSSCCRQAYASRPSKLVSDVLDHVERYADDEVTSESLALLHKSLVDPLHHPLLYLLTLNTCQMRELLCAGSAANVLLQKAQRRASCGRPSMWRFARAAQAQTLRDILPPWVIENAIPNIDMELHKNQDVQLTAEAIYRSGVGGGITAIAALLNRIGSSNQAILQHFDLPGQVHVKGCWVIDLCRGYHQ